MVRSDASKNFFLPENHSGEGRGHARDWRSVSRRIILCFFFLFLLILYILYASGDVRDIIFVLSLYAPRVLHRVLHVNRVCL